jgi:hypothetical protein
MGEPRDFISDKKIYPPANECIYCGAHDGLTDEHTFPDGLGGRHILPKACCPRCQKVINEEVEQYCQRTLLRICAPFWESVALENVRQFSPHIESGVRPGK